MVFDNIRENIVVVDADNYEILHANQSFVESFGVPLEGCRMKRCYEVTHKSDRPCHEAGEECPVRQAAETGRVAKCVHIHKDISGE
ncbi:MAG: Fis family transcriptional regulator, partial [Deltaproteobacteria bacterium CG_4_9_14_3_um_filter_65_9]